MRVTDILNTKGSQVHSLPPQSTIQELLQKLADHRVGAVVVLEDDNRLGGIVSERDVVRFIRESGDLKRPVSHIMTRDVETAELEDEIEDLATKMTQRRVRHLPVVEDDQVVGIVSIGDVVKARLDDLQAERDHLESYLRS